MNKNEINELVEKAIAIREAIINEKGFCEDAQTMEDLINLIGELYAKVYIGG